MVDAAHAPDDWDTCPGCGRRHGQPESARFDDEGDPVSGGPWHPECAAAQMRDALKGPPDGVVYMYEGAEPGPLSD